MLELKSIHKSFGEKKVLCGISFKAEQGKAFGLLGRNGAGKTTTIRILMDVFSPDSGEVLWNGERINYSDIRFGYLPEERGLYPKKKIFDQLVYFARLKGLSAKDAEKSVNHWLSRLGMAAYKDKRLDTLSKGNQQKIQLITALAHDPQVIILDEPFSGLDPVNAMALKDVVKEEIAKGKIVLFSSHQMNYIEEFCDSIAIINNGEAVLYGELRDIKRNYPRNRLVIRSEESDRIKEEYGERCVCRGGGELLITMASEGEKSDVMQKLCQKYDIDEIKVYEPTLNDIFVQYAGERE